MAMEHLDAAMADHPMQPGVGQAHSTVCNTPAPLTFSRVVVQVPDHTDFSPRQSYTDLELNLQVAFNPFNLPTVESVAYVIKGLFPEDDGLTN